MTIQYSDIIKQLNVALSELDARLQDGVIAPEKEIKELKKIGSEICIYADNLWFNHF